MSLKKDIRQSAVKYIGEFGYGEALIDPLLSEFDNLIDTLGESKFSELIRVICGPPASGAAQSPAETAAGKPHSSHAPAGLNDAMRHEIIEMIKRELKSAGAVPLEAHSVESPAAATAAPSPAAVPPAAAEVVSGPEMAKRTEKFMRRAMDRIAEDLSTVIGDKITLSNAVVKNTNSSDILANTADRFITLATAREDGLTLYARMSAPGLVKISGIMAMVPAAVLEEKSTKLSLNEGDLDTIKEVCNQITGSVSKVVKGDKFKLGQVVFHNERDKEEELFPDDSGEYLSVGFTWGTTAESYKNVTLYIKSSDLSKVA